MHWKRKLKLKRRIKKGLGRALCSVLLILVFTAQQAQLIGAFEAHVVNVTATIVDRCQLGFSISGMKFNDLDMDGQKDSGEEGLSGWVIVLNKGPFEAKFDYDNSGYISMNDKPILQNVVNGTQTCPVGKECDFNNDSVVDASDVNDFIIYINDRDFGSQQTLSDGTYVFNNLSEGDYVIYEVMQDGWTNSTPFIQYVKAECGGNTIDFGNFQGGHNTCGNGILQPENGEECDDSNTLDGDGCSSECKIEHGQCDARSPGYWKNHEGCPQESNWKDEINAFSQNNLMGAFANTSGHDICVLLDSGQCPSGGTIAGQLCRAQGKALADLSNIVSGHLDTNALIAGADDGSDAFDHLGLSGVSTVKEALNAVEKIIKDPNHTRSELVDAGYVASRIYTFYETECKVRPQCIFPGCGNSVLETSEECDDGNTLDGDGCSMSCTNEAKICGMKYNDFDQDGTFDSNERGIANWTIELKTFEECEAGDEWGDSVVSQSQGKRKDGTIVLDDRSNPTSALGVAENDTVDSHFFSLGFGDASSTAVIILKFDNYILNGAGADISITEATSEPYPDERADVFVSQDASNWFFAGNISKDGTVDISTASSSLVWVQYVKIVDRTEVTLHADDADGYDVDGVKALHCGSGFKAVDIKTTDEKGNYCFENVLPGMYRVNEVMQEGWKNSTDIFKDVILKLADMPEILFGNYLENSSGVVLNEFVPDPVGKDNKKKGLEGEWVELYNNSAFTVDLFGWRIKDKDGNYVGITFLNTDSGSTVIGAKGSGNEWLVVFLNKALLDNDGDTVHLVDSHGAILDSFAFTSATDTDPQNDPNATPGDPNTIGGNKSGIEGKSFARIPDGIGGWVDPIPTPGRPNQLNSPEEMQKYAETVARLEALDDAAASANTGGGGAGSVVTQEIEKLNDEISERVSELESLADNIASSTQSIIDDATDWELHDSQSDTSIDQVDVEAQDDSQSADVPQDADTSPEEVKNEERRDDEDGNNLLDNIMPPAPPPPPPKFPIPEMPQLPDVSLLQNTIQEIADIITQAE